MSRITTDDDDNRFHGKEKEENITVAVPISHFVDETPFYLEKPSRLIPNINEDALIMIFLELRDYAEKNSLPILNTHHASSAFVSWMKR